MSRGLQVMDKVFEFDCEVIGLYGKKLCDDDLKELLDALAQAKFTRVKKISLVSSASALQLCHKLCCYYAHAKD